MFTLSLNKILKLILFFVSFFYISITINTTYQAYTLRKEHNILWKQQAV